MNRFLLATAIILTFASCSNELDLLDDWKETMVVYGLLDQYDTAAGKPQYIKINKAFLGKGNALQMAQNYDSINYANQLNVKLERWLNGNLVTSYTLQKDSSISKDPGIFSYPSQVIYATNAGLDEDSEYRLVINNTSTGNIVTANTKLVKNFIIESPNSSGGFLGISNPAGKQKIQWISAVNGKAYQVVIRFFYDEKDISSGTLTSKSIDWVFQLQKSLSTTGGEGMEITYYNSDFYKFIKATILPNSGVIRYARKLDYIFSVAAEDFDTYMQVYQPSNTIAQDKPEYTNIENGLGLFSSRLNIIRGNISLTSPSVDSLCAGQYTATLGFCNTNTSSPYYCN